MMNFDARVVQDTSAWLTQERYPRKVVCATGHRPNKLRGGYRFDAEPLIEQAMFGLLKLEAGLVLSGMALGWDQVVCEAALRLRVPFVAVVPMLGQEKVWPLASRQRFEALCEQALSVVVLSDAVSSSQEAAARLNARNEFMVRHASAVLALWNGSAGGTGNALRCADRFRVHTLNVWDPQFAAQ